MRCGCSAMRSPSTKPGWRCWFSNWCRTKLPAALTKSIKAPTIGIGAGPKTDGQVLVITDVLGFTPTNFQHNRRYQDVGRLMLNTAKAYAQDVRSGKFPAAENVFSMDKDELAIFLNQKA